MTMQARPGSALEVVETEFFLQLLVSLLANPARLDGGSKRAQVSRRRQVGEIVFLLSRHPVFADEPSLLARQMLLTLVGDPLRRSVRDPHADRGKTSLELAFRAVAPTDGAPSGVAQHVMRRYRQNIRDVPLSGTAALRNRPGQLHIGSIYLEVWRNSGRPGQFACCERLAERSAHPITGVRQHAAKAHTGRDGTVDLRQSQLRLCARGSIFGWNTRALEPCPIAGPTLGKKQPQRQHDRYFVACQCQRHQGLAVRGLAQRRSILRSDTDRMRAFLGYRGV